uniref:galactosylceramidase n=1 Tax=Macrostomum lignano TaxID=282301 RepID=A0A1I8G3D0_9PLAT
MIRVPHRPAVTVILTALLALSIQALSLPKSAPAAEIKFSLAGGLAQKFEGIGGISGGGPKFGAALQILKVEIGGDSQSTDGTESSHMHTADDVSFDRGYEWSLMKDVKKINNNIKLYGLPWVFPGWIGGPDLDPYYNNSSNLLRYIMTWVKGAKAVHGLHMEYLGMLRKALDASGFASTRIVATDSLWDVGFLKAAAANKALYDAVDVLGAHYPGADSPPEAKLLNKTMICSEEFSAYNDINGGGCWARILNEPFVMGNLSGAIAWNLLTSYYRGFPYSDNSLMSAREPWSGNYQVKPPIWVTAHHTHFSEPGWRYLPVGNGSGLLPGNGSYITYVSPDAAHVTVVIETMDPHDAHCFYSMPQYPIADVQTVVLKFTDGLSSITRFRVRQSVFDYGNRTARLFQKLPDFPVVNGTLKLTLAKNTILTLTTMDDAGPTDDPSQIVNEKAPTNETFFPDVYREDINELRDEEEPRYLAPQAGVWEVRSAPDGKRAMAQVVTQPPVDTCYPRFPRPGALIGDYSWTDSRINCSVWLPTWANASTGVYLGLQANQAGASMVHSSGVFAWLLPLQGPGCGGYCTVLLMTRDYGMQQAVYSSVLDGLARDSWISVSLQMLKGFVQLRVNHKLAYNGTSGWEKLPSGWAAVGTQNFGVAYFKDLSVERLGD